MPSFVHYISRTPGFVQLADRAALAPSTGGHPALQCERRVPPTRSAPLGRADRGRPSQSTDFAYTDLEVTCHPATDDTAWIDECEESTPALQRGYGGVLAIAQFAEPALALPARWHEDALRSGIRGLVTSE